VLILFFEGGKRLAIRRNISFEDHPFVNIVIVHVLCETHGRQSKRDTLFDHIPHRGVGIGGKRGMKMKIGSHKIKTPFKIRQNSGKNT
jgi:hypothetical protein